MTSNTTAYDLPNKIVKAIDFNQKRNSFSAAATNKKNI